MPAIELSLDRLQRLLGRECTVKDLELDLQWIGLDLDDVNEDTIKVEYNPNRPDFSSPEGISRALKGYYEMELGLQQYPLKDSGYEIHVQAAVEPVRPYIVTAVVRG
ncbi:phenylalanine--tRNA ligase subunit beta, partial [Candidatus Bathyarchaeota archaeon]|nr:phenylalanine--tRNA ligase subunit beta [Candidatus Bathyarchaeota archaeon]